MRHFRQLLPLLLLPLGLQTALAQTAAPTLNLSTDLVRLGIAANNMSPNQPALDSGPLLESGVKYAASHQLGLVIASQGAYYFLSGSQSNSATHVLLSGLSTTLTIDLQGSDLYFAHPEKTGLFLASLTNVTLQNFTMDYLQQRYTQLQVTGVNATQRQIQYTVAPGWQTPTALAALNPLFASTGTPPTYVYVFRNGQPWLGFTRIAVQTPFTDGQMTLATGTSAAAISGIQPGDVAVLNLRGGGNAILATGLTGCTLQNIKIYSGFVGLRTVSNSSTLLQRVEVAPRPGTDRLISTVADGISPSQPGLNNIVRLCRCIRTCDDGFSPNTLVFASAQASLGTRSLQVQGDVNTALNGGTLTLPNGSNVTFQRASDGAILGVAAVVSQASASPVGGLPQVVLNFDRDLPTNLSGSYVYSTDASWRGGSLLLDRNTVQQQGWARGISLWGLMNVTLSGNYIRRSSMSGVAIMHQLFPTDWIVPPVINLTLSNNVIDGTVITPDVQSTIELGGVQALAMAATGVPMTLSPDQNISLAGNFIANPGRSAIWLGNTTGGSVTGNYLFNPNDNPNLSLAYASFSSQELQPLVVEPSTNITLGTNKVDQASGRAFVTDQGYNELAAYAPGSIIRLNAYNLGLLAPNETVSLTDADGKSWPLSVAAISTHAVDVTLPPNVGLGGSVLTLTAGNATYLGTLFLDSQDNIPAINQPTYEISAGALTAPAQATTLSFLVVTQPGNLSGVTATDSFVTAGPGGAGTGVVLVGLAKNSGPARTTTITIAAQPIVLTEAAGP
jgi:hypothetical protein